MYFLLNMRIFHCSVGLLESSCLLCLFCFQVRLLRFLRMVRILRLAKISRMSEAVQAGGLTDLDMFFLGVLILINIERC